MSQRSEVSDKRQRRGSICFGRKENKCSSGPQGKKENQLDKMLPKKQSQRSSRKNIDQVSALFEALALSDLV